MKRICFLFNHDQIHQLAHSLPIALALAARGEHRITLAYVRDAVRAEIARQADPALLAKMELVQLGLKRGGSQALAGLLERIVPATKLLIYRDNLDFFRSFEVIFSNSLFEVSTLTDELTGVNVNNNHRFSTIDDERTTRR